MNFRQSTLDFFLYKMDMNETIMKTDFEDEKENKCTRCGEFKFSKTCHCALNKQARLRAR